MIKDVTKDEYLKTGSSNTKRHEYMDKEVKLFVSNQDTRVKRLSRFFSTTKK